MFPDDAREGGASSADMRQTDSGWVSMGTGRAGGFDTDEFDPTANLVAETTLRDHLAEQAALAFADPAENLIAHYLIDLVDEAGYLHVDLHDVADALGASPSVVEAVLIILQTFDPAGVCARDLAECLAIQLREKDRFDPAMQTLIAHLDLLARRDFAAIKRLCQVDDEDLAEMIGDIKSLNPKPGLSVGGGIVTPIVPDIFVRARPDGSWQVELNTDALPRVLVNQDYYATIAAGTRNEADKTYLSDCLQTANWLVKSLDQRARTILKVASEIVCQQDAFLVDGVQYLRPLNLRTVADAISMHESTVSRVTANKYMATPRGTFELKYFFTAAIAAADGGEAHSAESVRQRIKQMIDQEDPEKVLSDDQLVAMLRDQGVDIARRTVAKYREALHIPSSVQRRRDKRAAT